MKRSTDYMIQVSLFLLVCAVFVVAVCIRAENAYAAPSMCANSTARAVKILGDGPAACALSVCRPLSTHATKVVQCNIGPGCANQFPYVEQWQAQAGAWGGLPACPAWTNTAIWQ